MKEKTISRRIGKNGKYESRFKIKYGESTPIIKDGIRLRPNPEIVHHHPFEILNQYEKWCLGILSDYGFDVTDYPEKEFPNKELGKKTALSDYEKKELIEEGVPQAEIPEFSEVCGPETVLLWTHVAQTIDKPEFELMEEGLACKILYEISSIKVSYDTISKERLIRSTCELMSYVHQIDFGVYEEAAYEGLDVIDRRRKGGEKTAEKHRQIMHNRNQRIKALKKNGTTTAVLAERFGLSTRQIQNILKKN